MRKIYAALLFLVAGNLIVAAQDTPKVEIFTGYSHLRVGFADAQVPGSKSVHGGLNGWNASGAFNGNRWLGFAADFGGYYGSPFSQVTFKPADCILCTQTVNTTINSVHSFLAGPKLSAREGRVTIFAQTLFGGARMHKEVSGFFVPARGPVLTSTKFALAVGGGVDWQLTKFLSVRAQPDYLLTQFFSRIAAITSAS